MRNVQFIVNKERIGKANALNSTVKLSTGKVLLFLDSDVGIPNDPDYLRKIIMEMQHTDILDIKKKVTKDKSFLSKMAYYEYLTFNISSWLASRYMHKCPAVGAAFAIKREIFEKVHGFRKVVAEDIDIATRAFLEDSSFAYSHDVEVENEVHSDWKKWFHQRRRWAIGQALWLKEQYAEPSKQKQERYKKWEKAKRFVRKRVGWRLLQGHDICNLGMDLYPGNNGGTGKIGAG